MYRMGANGAWDRLYLANTDMAQSGDPNVYISGHGEGLDGILSQQDIFIYYTQPEDIGSAGEPLFVDECRVQTDVFDLVIKEPVNGSGTQAESSWRSSGTTKTAFLFKRKHTATAYWSL